MTLVAQNVQVYLHLLKFKTYYPIFCFIDNQYLLMFAYILKEIKIYLTFRTVFAEVSQHFINIF